MPGANSKQDGSSPHARGTPGCLCLRYKIARFIPALAGNTSSVATFAALVPVHPRTRGEHTGSEAQK